MNNFIVAKSAGFCFGVSRSVEMAQQLLEKEDYRAVYACGNMTSFENASRLHKVRQTRIGTRADEDVLNR